MIFDQVKIDTFGPYEPYGKNKKRFASFWQLAFDDVIRVCWLVLTVSPHDTSLNLINVTAVPGAR